MSTQGNGHRLSIRDESADVLEQAIEGFRQGLPVDNGALTRYIKRDVANPLEMVALLIRHLPADRAALVAGYLDDVFEDAHGGRSDEEDLSALFVQLDAMDSTEDQTRFMVANARYTEPELRAWLRKNREYDHLADRIRRRVSRLLPTMRRPRPAPSWARRKAVGA